MATPAYVAAFVTARQQHFDTKIQELVATAVAQRSRDEVDALVAAEVEQRLVPIVAVLEAEKSRVSELVEQLDNTEATVVQPLREERDNLAEQLRQRNAILRNEANDTAIDDLKRQLDESQQREAVLQARCDTVTSQLNEALQQTASSSSTVATLQQTVQSLEAQLGEVAAGVEAQVHGAVSDLAAALAQAQADLDASTRELNATVVKLDEATSTIARLTDDKQHLESEMSTSQVRLLELEARVAMLTSQLKDAAQTNTGDFGASLMLRSSDASARRQLLDFWRDGHSTIQDLTVKLQRASQVEAELKKQAAAATDVVQQRSRLMQSIAALTAEVDALQEENRRLRTNTIAVEQEAEALQQHLSVALQGHLTAEEVADCAAQFREAAAKRAALDEATLSDPAAVKSALQQLQSVKHELQDLSKRKEAFAATIVQQEATIASLTARQCTARVAAEGFSADVVAQVSAILRPLGVDEEKLKRLEDLRRVRTSQAHAATLAGRVQELEAQLETTQRELTTEREESERVRNRLEAAVSHYRDQTRVTNLHLASLKKRVETSNTTKVNVDGVLRTSAHVGKAIAEICASTLSALTVARLDLIVARAENDTLRRNQQLAIDAALDELSDEALCGHLRLHLEAMQTELRRRQRRDHVDEAADRAALAHELQQRTSALSEAVKRVRELGESAAATDAASAESVAWCTTVDAVFAKLTREVHNAVGTAAALGQTTGRDIAQAFRVDPQGATAAQDDEDDVTNAPDTSSLFADAAAALDAAEKLMTGN